jgi:hypothetical protein
MIFVKTFKGYEDRTQEIDKAVNDWIQASNVDVVDVKAVLSHEHESRARSGDLVYVVLYKAAAPLD